MSDAEVYNDIADRSTFIDAITMGTPIDLAAMEVGWTPHQLKARMRDEDFAALVAVAQSHSIDKVEKVLMDMALKKEHFGAIQMILFNRRPERWKDVKRIEVKTETTINIGEISATKVAVLELLREHGTAALQPGGALDDDDGIVDAEVVGDGS